MEILKCKCGLYLTCDKLKEVVVVPGSWEFPQEIGYVCPICGLIDEAMIELDEDEIVKLLNY